MLWLPWNDARGPALDEAFARGATRTHLARCSRDPPPTRSPISFARLGHVAPSARGMSRRVAMTQLVVDQAIGRGELPSTTDPNLIIEALVAPLWFRLLLTGEPLDDDFLDRLVELVASGAGA